MSSAGVPASSPPSYAVGIVHYRTPAALERCLASVDLQSVGPLALRVIDIEGGARDLAARSPGTDWVEAPNRGYSAAANRLADWAESLGADFLLLLNADVVLEPEFARQLLRHTAAEPKVALASGKLLRRDGRHLDSAGVVLPRNRRPRDRGSEELDRGQYDRVERVFGASGAALWMRLEAVRDLRLEGELFDEDFFMYHEDTDLAWRAALLGWSVLYVPPARALHERGWQQEGRFEVPVEIRRHSFKNHYLQMIKNERGGEWLRDLGVIAGWEVLRLGFALLRDRGMLRGYAEAWRAAPAARRKRAVLQARARDRSHDRVHFGSKGQPGG